jgi:hypothetical protein
MREPKITFKFLFYSGNYKIRRNLVTKKIFFLKKNWKYLTFSERW